MIMHAEGSTEDEGKHQDGSNIMIDQTTGYPPQFTMEQLQLLSQFQVIFENFKLIIFLIFLILFIATTSPFTN